MKTRSATVVAFAACALITLVGATGAATLFGLVDTGDLYRSNDGGVTWTGLATLSFSDGVAIAAAETPSELFLTTRSGSVYRSTDAGANWTAVGTVPASDVAEMVIRANGDILMLTEAGTIWRSQNDGVAFAALATLTGSNQVSMTSNTVEDLFALARTGEVARSIDGGATWTVAGVITTSGATEIRSVATTLYVMTSTGDIARSLDDGATWTFIGTISQVRMVSMTNDDVGLVAATREGLATSSPDGVTWTWQGSVNQLDLVALGNDTPTVSGISERPPPASLQLLSLWPNPAGGVARATTFSFRLTSAADVRIVVYNVAGQLVAERRPEFFDAPGVYTVRWNVGPLASGTYFARLETGEGRTAHRKLTIVR